MGGRSRLVEKASPKLEIIDAVSDPKYEQFLYWCIIHRRAKWIPIAERENYEENQRYRYLKNAVPRGFHMKILFIGGDYGAMIEYAPAEVSGYPMKGGGVVAMHCIWVFSKYKGNGYGRLLVRDMVQSEKDAAGFATIGLEDHWTAWLKRKHMEALGFRSVRSLELEHRTKYKGRRFTLHLMWMPVKADARPPEWDSSKLLEGYYACWAHPLSHYRYGAGDMGEIFER